MPERSQVTRSSVRRSGSSSGGGGGGGAPTTSTYKLASPDALLPNAQSMDALDSGLVVNDGVTGLFSIAPAHTQPANWGTATRYYALDYDAGSDANVGYSDVSMAAAGLVAKKTWQGLQAVLPLVGNGCAVIVAIKNRAAGAVYLKQDGVTNADLVWIGYGGYRFVGILGTSDFSDNAADQIKSGGVVSAAGPGAGGLWTCDAGGTVTTFAVDAAETLPAVAGIVGKRVRFTGNITAGLANATGFIYDATAGLGGTITVGTDLGSAPAAGDEFYIEQPGVAFNRVVLRADVGTFKGQPSGGYMQAAFSVCGIAATLNADASWSVMGQQNQLTTSFCEDRGGTTSWAYFYNLGDLIQTYYAPRAADGTTSSMGTGFRCSGGMSVVNANYYESQAILVASTAQFASFFNEIRSGYVGIGSVFFGSAGLYGCGSHPFASGFSNSFRVGSGGWGSAVRRMRVSGVTSGVGGLANFNSNICFNALTFDNNTVPCIYLSGYGNTNTIDDCVGSTGNTSYGIIGDNQEFCSIAFGGFTANTVTGTLGDILIAGSAVLTHAALLITNVIDNFSNNWRGQGKSIVGQGMLVTNKSGGALAVGELVRGNATTGQVTKAQGDTAANATGSLRVMVTAPANDAAGYCVPLGQGSWVLFDAAPAAEALAYLDEGTAGMATTTVPPAAATNQKRRLGQVTDVSGSMGRVVGSPELLAVLSDGVAP